MGAGEWLPGVRRRLGRLLRVACMCALSACVQANSDCFEYTVYHDSVPTHRAPSQPRGRESWENSMLTAVHGGINSATT